MGGENLLVPLQPFASTFALNGGTQDLGICGDDTVIEALVELGDDVAPVDIQEESRRFR